MTTLRSQFLKLFEQEDINFLLTNRIPRRFLTQWMGWFSKIEQPIVRDLSIGVWRLFTDLDLSDAKKADFHSMHDCFIRELKDGARTIDSRREILASPCDAIVGACGEVAGTEVFQVKGFPYTLQDLFAGADLAEAHRDGLYVTLRLTAGMYHRFHAPHDCRIDQVRYISGDTWNVNPIALRRIERLFCKNERAVVRMTLAATEHVVTLVPIAAILVASLRLHCLDATLNLKHQGIHTFRCDVHAGKGEELGWFEHGSTIVVFAPPGFLLCDNVREGAKIRLGEPLMRLP